MDGARAGLSKLGHAARYDGPTSGLGPGLMGTHKATGILASASLLLFLASCSCSIVPLSFALCLAAMQLALDTVTKSTARGAVRFAATRSGKMDSRTRFTILCKRLQGFHPDALFEYRKVGQCPLGYVPVFASWLLSLLVCSQQPISTAYAAAAMLTLASYAIPLHAITLGYTGRDGNIHGFGFNLYSSAGGFDGERFFAIDWHEEKLAERGSDGRFLPRSRQRTVRWPHVHLCALRLEFWPWLLEPTTACADAMAEHARMRANVKAAKSQRSIAQGIDMAALEMALDEAVAAACSATGDGGLTTASNETPEALGRLLARRAHAAVRGAPGHQAQPLAAHVAALSRELASGALLRATTGGGDLSEAERQTVLEVGRRLAGQRVGKSLPEARRVLRAVASVHE